MKYCLLLVLFPCYFFGQEVWIKENKHPEQTKVCIALMDEVLDFESEPEYEKYFSVFAEVNKSDLNGLREELKIRGTEIQYAIAALPDMQDAYIALFYEGKDENTFIAKVFMRMDEKTGTRLFKLVVMGPKFLAEIEEETEDENPPTGAIPPPPPPGGN